MASAGEERLLPCPFCGGTELDFSQGSTFRWLVATCRGCGASIDEVRVQTLGDGNKEQWRAAAEAEAVALWNRRAAPDMPAALRRIVAEMREYEKAPRNSGIERTGANQIFGRLASAIERAFTPSEKGGTDGRDSATQESKR